MRSSPKSTASRFPLYEDKVPASTKEKHLFLLKRGLGQTPASGWGGSVLSLRKNEHQSVPLLILRPLLSPHRHTLCLWVSPSFPALHCTTSCPPQLPADTTDSFLSLVTCKVPATQRQGFSCTTITSSAPHSNAGCSEQPSTAAASRTSTASPGYPWLSSGTLTEDRTF